MALILASSFFVMLNPVVVSAGYNDWSFIMLNPIVVSAEYKDWSTAKQAGYIVEEIDICQEYVGIFRHEDISTQISKIRKYYRRNGQFKDGVHRADSGGADICRNCVEVCLKHEEVLLRLLNKHLSTINSTRTGEEVKTKKLVENCLRLGKEWDYVNNVCKPAQSSVKNIENKCTELGFTKGTEKHGDCVMKLYK